MIRRSPTVFTLVVFLVLATRLHAQPAVVPAREIVQVGTNLFVATEGTARTVIFVTPAGIALSDPLNTPFAQWLKAQLSVRFPDREVKYVIYTSLDFDLLRGARVFNKSATIVGAAGFVEALQVRSRALPTRLQPFDQNADGVLDSGEIANSGELAEFLYLDRNKDSKLSAPELWDEVLFPEHTVSGRTSTRLGNVVIGFNQPRALTRSTDLLIEFPSEKLAFSGRAPDFLKPFSSRGYGPSDVQGWAQAIRRFTFTRLFVGDGREYDAETSTTFADYVDGLVRQVTVAYHMGQSLREVHDGPAGRGMGGTPYAATRDEDVSLIYNRLPGWRLDVFGGVQFSSAQWSSGVCDGLVVCTREGQSTVAFAGGVGATRGRIRFSAEVASRGENSLAGASVTQSVGIVNRDTRFALLVGVRAFKTGRIAVSAVAGPAVTITASSSRRHTPASFTSTSFRPEVNVLAEERQMRPGATAGFDVMWQPAPLLAIVLPLRATFSMRGSSADTLTGPEYRGGIALRVTFKAPRP